MTGIRLGSWVLLAVAAPLAAPSIFFPWVLAVRIEAGDDELVVTNLFFLRRRIRRDSLGRPKIRLTAQGSIDHIRAPRRRSAGLSPWASAAE